MGKKDATAREQFSSLWVEFFPTPPDFSHAAPKLPQFGQDIEEEYLDSGTFKNFD